jgi:hypothetical protein
VGSPLTFLQIALLIHICLGGPGMTMIYNSITDLTQMAENDNCSLVEKVFCDPRSVSQGEYTTIYEFLLNQGISDDPDVIIGVLKEFAGWANLMIEQMRKATSLPGK